MAKESAERQRARLLQDPEVQMMIRMRAFEIYQMRGGQPGNPADDWFQAELEVLSFLIADEAREAAESAAPRSRRKTVAGIEFAGAPDNPGEPETSGGAFVEIETPKRTAAKKPRVRAAAKAAATRARKAPAAEKKAATTSARKASSSKTGKPTEGAKKPVLRKSKTRKDEGSPEEGS